MKTKKAILTALVLALCLLASCACAQGWATVRGQSDRVHLRAGCSKDEPSMGLYFTGCPVWVTGEAWNGYSAVVIGMENGYMMTKYLSYDYVTPKTPVGTVKTRNGSRVNLRSEPNMDAPVVRTLSSGTEVTVYGETKSGWYYVDTGWDEGYIKSNLVKLSSSQTRSMSVSDRLGAGAPTSASIPTKTEATPYTGGTASSGGAVLVQTLELDEGGRRVLVEVTQIGENPGYGEATYSVRVEMDGETTQSFVYTGGRIDEYWKAVYPTDVNMDGYPDLLLMGIAGASDAFGTHFLYDPASGRFVEHDELADFSVYRCTLYPQTGYVLNYLHDGAATGTWALYQWQNGQLVQLARASMLTPDADITSDKLHAKAERLVSGTWQTVYDETFDFDEAAWQVHYDAILDALWGDVNPGEGQQLVPGLM